MIVLGNELDLDVARVHCGEQLHALPLCRRRLRVARSAALTREDVAAVFRKYGFLAMIVVRLADYLVLHILYGNFLDGLVS